MSITLYGAPLSPFVRKVRLCLLEKALDYQLEIITPFGQPAWYRELNPLGRIPALRDGDFTLADSSVICQYLEERYPAPPNLQGDAPASRADTRRFSCTSIRISTDATISISADTRKELR